MILLIIGRSGVGKDHLARLLKEMGLNIVISYATRPRRNKKENTHIFISSEEAKTYTDKVATTTINGYEYFATKKQVEKSDIYIIDPNGVYELVQNMPDTEFGLVYIKSDETLAAERAAKRGNNYAEQKEIFVKRRASEDAEFSEFEETWVNNTGIFENSNVVLKRLIINDYSKVTMQAEARNLYRMCMNRNKESDRL